MSQTIDIFPKTQLASDFTQSIYQATDTGNAAQGTLQVWIDSSTSGTTATVTIEEADINEEGEYKTSDNPTVSVVTGAMGTPVALQQLFIPRRYIRLKISPSATANVRARLILVGR